MRYVRKDSTGGWYYSTQVPTDPNEPIITDEDVRGIKMEAPYPTPTGADQSFEEFRKSRYPDERSRGLAARDYAERRGETPTKAQATMMADEWLLGEGKREGHMLTFTDPEGRTRTYSTPTARLMSEGLPRTSTYEYTRRDQRKIENLYQSRSQIATDPELASHEKELAMSQVDEQIQQIPFLPSALQPSTAQENFQASVVTDSMGQQGTVNPRTGEHRPFKVAGADAAIKVAQDRAKRKQTLMQGFIKDEMSKLLSYEKATNEEWAQWFADADARSEAILEATSGSPMGGAGTPPTGPAGIVPAPGGLAPMPIQIDASPQGFASPSAAPIPMPGQLGQAIQPGVGVSADKITVSQAGTGKLITFKPPEGWNQMWANLDRAGKREVQGSLASGKTPAEVMSERGAIPTIKTEAEYNTLPGGMVYRDPGGVIRFKKYAWQNRFQKSPTKE